MKLWNKLTGRLWNSIEQHHYQLLYEQHQLQNQLEDLQIALGAWHSKSLRSQQIKKLQDAEFKVFSQWGEDGIIQYLIQQIPIENDAFIEFGVQDYRESNTRFLLANNNWHGLIIDGDTAHIRFMQSNAYNWRYDLDAISAFINRDNINQLISDASFHGDIGLLSIDVDGMDYWIWDAINTISARIVVIEYNSLFGAEHAITVPYKADFVATKEHYSGLYYGASLAALTCLGDKKGYKLVGSNSAGNNAFFVRQDVLAQMDTLTAQQAHVCSRFRTARDEQGNLSRLRDQSKQLSLISHLPVIDVISNRTMTIETVFNAT